MEQKYSFQFQLSELVAQLVRASAPGLCRTERQMFQLRYLLSVPFALYCISLRFYSIYWSLETIGMRQKVPC